MSGFSSRLIAIAFWVAGMLVASLAGPAWAGGEARTAQLYRDQYGMAHLFADREEDAFYALGYALGEDRLQQVLTWYVAARGELAATFGRNTPPLPQDRMNGIAPGDSALHDAVANDIAARKARVLETARDNFVRLPAQLQANLRAFVDGLQAYMRAHPKKTPEWAPKLEPALPLALYSLMANEQRGICDARRQAERSRQTTASTVTTDDYVGPLGASNAWAVAGSRTADGRVIFAADSHGALAGYGAMFYPYRIKAGALDVVAFDRPGTLNFLFGHTPYFAWGLTEGPRFVADCYRIQLETNSPRTFQYDGVKQEMLAVPYSVAVKGAAAVTGTFEYTRHNGILSPVEIREGDTAYVVSSAYADRVGFGTAQGYRMAIATTRAEFEAALAQLDMYPANLIVGGADGTIMYIRPGRIPVRPTDLDVRRPLDGNTSKTAWRGFHPYAELLKLINPPFGFVSNSNISPDMMYSKPLLQADEYPSYFAFEPGHTGTRQQRHLELLESNAAMTLVDAIAVVMDETVIAARPWAPAIARLLHEHPQLLADQPQELRPFLEELARFDGAFSKESRGALYHSVLRIVLHDRHTDDMDTLAQAIEEGAELRDDQEELLVRAASEARLRILSLYGREDLTWGDVHRVGRGSENLPVGGGVIVMGVKRGGWPWRTGYLGISAPARSGSTPRALVFSIDPETNLQYMISGQRIPFVVHFAADGVRSYAQALWGVSEEPASRHYSDQARLASNKALRPIPLSLSALKRERSSETVLTIAR